MCVEVYNTKTKQYALSVKQLSEMLNLDTIDVPFDEAYKTIYEDGCLCQIDVEKACSLAGFECTLNDSYDEYHIYKK